MLSLSEYAQKLDQQYQRHFAGHPRYSRDAALLRRMAADTRTQLGQADLGNLEQPLAQKLSEQVKLFETEAAQIEEIQSADTEDFLAHEYRSWLDLIFDRYRRNFAGQNRGERDLHLLRSMQLELAKVEERLTKLSLNRASDVITQAQKVSRDHSKLFQSEFVEIAKLRDVGEQGQRTSMLANDANRLFEDWGDFFAGKSRVSRRIERLELMVEHVAWLADKMSSLQAGDDPKRLNEKNAEICLQRREFYKSELAQIRAARSQTGFDELVLALGEAANAVFAQYRTVFAGKDRKTVPLKALNQMCEELFDLAIQMNDLDMVRIHEANQQNLSTVLDQLRLFQREYDTIKETQENG